MTWDDDIWSQELTTHLWLDYGTVLVRFEVEEGDLSIEQEDGDSVLRVNTFEELNDVIKVLKSAAETWEEYLEEEKEMLEMQEQKDSRQMCFDFESSSESADTIINKTGFGD